jgi:hypothetical protein
LRVEGLPQSPQRRLEKQIGPIVHHRDLHLFNIVLHRRQCLFELEIESFVEVSIQVLHPAFAVRSTRTVSISKLCSAVSHRLLPCGLASLRYQ